MWDKSRRPSTFGRLPREIAAPNAATRHGLEKQLKSKRAQLVRAQRQSEQAGREAARAAQEHAQREAQRALQQEWAEEQAREAERARQEAWDQEQLMARARKQNAQEQWEEGYF